MGDAELHPSSPELLALAGIGHFYRETSIQTIGDMLNGYPSWTAMGVVTKLFLSNRSQAVRIPAQLRLPDSVKDVEVRACGEERIISPVGQRWDTFFSAEPRRP